MNGSKETKRRSPGWRGTSTVKLKDAVSGASVPAPILSFSLQPLPLKTRILLAVSLLGMDTNPSDENRAELPETVARTRLYRRVYGGRLLALTHARPAVTSAGEKVMMSSLALELPTPI